MILAKKCNFRGAVPLRFALENFLKRGFLTNKQTIFLNFFTSKSFVLLCLVTDGVMRKKYLLKECKNSNYSFSLETKFMRVLVGIMGVKFLNFKIFPPE